MSSRNFLESFKYAFDGLGFAIRTETHIRIHIAFACFAVLFAVLLKVARIEFLFICVSIALVFVAEIVNTAFEILIDFLKGQKKSVSIRVLKDIAAAGVLVASINSLIVACFILAPKFIKLFA
ncbi:MAG: diacylglycerol kinase family protein [Candidatus Omnitrophica bacterium]|nr:diacylglycerol kinase family protein [Candidatus Omnitrophota bacterium]